MKPKGEGLWTAAPHEWWPADRLTPPLPVASDNAAESKVLLYGPKGEALIRQEPRPVGFRPREPR